MTAPATLLPAAALGIAGAAYAESEGDNAEATIALAGGAAAVGLGAALVIQESNYVAGGALILAGGLTALLLLKRR